MYKKPKNQNTGGASRFPTCSLGHSDFFSQNHHNDYTPRTHRETGGFLAFWRLTHATKFDEKAHFFPVVGNSEFYRRRTCTRCTLTANGVKERAEVGIRPKELFSFISATAGGFEPPTCKFKVICRSTAELCCDIPVPNWMLPQGVNNLH